MTIEGQFRELIANDRKFIETLFVVENKARHEVPFCYNTIQVAADSEESGMDIWVKPAQVGFSTERIAKRLKDTLTTPGTNTVLVAYEDFITERLLNKVNFFYNHLATLGIPGFPEIHHDSTYEKTFRFIVHGKVISTSSIYIASARSYVAGRAETIHHLLLDEFAFYPGNAMQNIVSPALDRIPPGGTVDIYSTPNGEENDFYGMYQLAKEGKSVFRPHFFPWFLHAEYKIELGDERIIKYIPETNKVEFPLDTDEVNLVLNHQLTYSQIRWRRWKLKEKQSLRRGNELSLLFQQEFPEDDVSCFLATGNQLYDKLLTDRLTDMSYPAKRIENGLHVWYPYEKGGRYLVAGDPGQAKVSQTAIVVVQFIKDEHGNTIPRVCARDAGLYGAEVMAKKLVAASDMYGRAMITWEANAHGLAVTELLKNRRPIYFRKDIVSGRESLEPGWLTTGGSRGTKEYMLAKVGQYLPDLICHDIEIPRQVRNHRLVGDKVEVVGANDIFMALAIALCCWEPKVGKRGFVATSGWRW